MEAEAVVPNTLKRAILQQKAIHLPFWLILGLIAFGSLLIRIHVSVLALMDLDEWQHVFMASGARWADLSFELDTNAHPPLFFLLLRWLLPIKHSQLLFRSISILSGVGSVLLIGLVTRKVCRSAAVALLCATAFAFSASAITISTEVRSYQLTIALVLLAFLAYLEMLSEPIRKLRLRPYVVFTVASSAAVLCHYFTGLFLVACALVPIFLAVTHLPVRKHLFGRANRRALFLLCSSLAIPWILLLFLYQSHASVQPIQGYLYDFYFGWGQVSHETPLNFTFRNLQNLSNLFSPITFQRLPAFLVSLTLFCAAATYILRKSRASNHGDKEITNLPIVFFFSILFELILLSWEQKYPFGGMLRHQYIIAPFFVIAVFLLLDRLVSLVGSNLKVAILIVVAAFIIRNWVRARPHLIGGRGLVAYSAQYDNYRAAFPKAHAVYLDHFSVICYFIRTHDAPRHFVRRISDAAWIDQYSIEDGSAEGTQLFYDKTRINLDFADPTTYKSLAAAIRQSGAKDLTVYLLVVGNPFSGPAFESLKQVAAENAAREHLSLTKMVYDGTAVYADFTPTS